MERGRPQALPRCACDGCRRADAGQSGFLFVCVRLSYTQPAPVLVPEQAAKPEPAPAAKEEKKVTLPCDHVVRTGDNLWSLARKYYGTGAKWKLIFDANKASLKNENFLEPGKVLKIPAAK